jgi:lipoprotein LprG
VPATAWIREDGDHALVEAQLEATQGNSVTMTTSDWGKPVTVNQP